MLYEWSLSDNEIPSYSHKMHHLMLLNQNLINTVISHSVKKRESIVLEKENYKSLNNDCK